MKHILANIRTGMVRISTYLGLANFLILVSLALKILHDDHFPTTNLYFFLAGAYVLAAILLTLAAWIDRRWIWPHEIGINQGINPLSIVWVTMAIRELHEARDYLELDSWIDLYEKTEDAARKMGLLEEFHDLQKQRVRKQ